MKVIVRGFAGGRLLFEEQVDAMCKDLRAVALDQVMRVLQYPDNMIELEFPWESDPRQRFFRIGTDPRGMNQPIPALEFITKHPEFDPSKVH